MSTPSPAGRISLPDAKPYLVTIENTERYPAGHPALLVFKEHAATKSWTASFSVPSLRLPEQKGAVTRLENGQYTFEFTLHKPTEDQQKAGYIKGTYIFSFIPPGTDPIQFGGSVNDPWPGEAEDNWTAEGRPPDSVQGGTYS